MMEQLTSPTWWEAAGVRAVKTVAQAAIAAIGAAVTMGGVDWAVVASTAALAGILSLLTSLAGLPEVKADQELAYQQIAQRDDDDESGDAPEGDTEPVQEGGEADAD